VRSVTLASCRPALPCCLCYLPQSMGTLFYWHSSIPLVACRQYPILAGHPSSWSNVTRTRQQIIRINLQFDPSSFPLYQAIIIYRRFQELPPEAIIDLHSHKFISHEPLFKRLFFSPYFLPPLLRSTTIPEGSLVKST